MQSALLAEFRLLRRMLYKMNHALAKMSFFQQCKMVDKALKRAFAVDASQRGEASSGPWQTSTPALQRLYSQVSAACLRAGVDLSRNIGNAVFLPQCLVLYAVIARIHMLVSPLAQLPPPAQHSPTARDVNDEKQASANLFAFLIP